MIKNLTVSLAILVLSACISYAGQKCTLSIGITGIFRPHEYISAEYGPKGYHITLANKIAEKMGCDLKLVKNNWSDKIRMLKEGSLDIAMLVEPQDYGFNNRIGLHSMTHFWFLARAGEESGISLFSVPDNITFLAASDSPVISYISKNYPEAAVIKAEDEYAALDRLLGGEGDAAVFPANFVLYNISAENIAKVKVVGRSIHPGQFALTFSDNDTILKDKVGIILEELQDDGEYTKILGVSLIRQEPKPWLKYIVWVSAGIVLVLVIIFLWNFSLRRMVKIRASSLIDEIEQRKKTEKALEARTLLYSQLSNWFKTILESIPENLCLINREGETLWSNIKDGGETLSVEQIKIILNDEISKVFTEGKAFNTAKVLDNGQSWDIRGVIVKTDNTPELFIMANNITEFVTLREEAFTTSKLRTLGEMALGVAHEINNPIGIIHLNLCMLEEYCTAPDSRAFLDLVKDSARRIKKTVEEMKAYGVKSTDNYELINISDCLSTAVTLSGQMIKKSTNNFSIKIDEGIPLVSGSRRQIEHVIVNLVHNACNALADRTKSIICSLSSGGGNSSVIFSIEDEGVGIPGEVLGKVTVPFFTTRRDKGGTGLGLSIVSRIIKEHGGILEIESKVNIGTVVRFSIPAASLEKL